MTAGGEVGELPLAEFEALATARLDTAILDYVQRGSGDETTLARNREAWLEVELRPRVLAGVGTPDMSVELLGKRRATPLFAAPTALNTIVHPDGEAAVARAAAAAGMAAYCLSTAAAIGAGELTAAAPDGARWQQLYILRDRGVTREQVAAATAAGFEALVLTVDTPVLSLRDHDARSEITARTGVGGGGSTPTRPADFVALLDPALGWDDLAELVAASSLPVIVKGLVRGDDAERAADAGAAAVIVSNHGGRQLDGAIPTARALTEVADAVGERLDVLVDGGVRRGTDVVKALALGARAVGIGRPYLWGLAVAGELGARRVFERLRRETAVALTLAGSARADAVDRDLVRFAHQTSGR